MFIDFLTVLMINLAAGIALLALFVYRGITAEDTRAYAAGFGVVGLIAFLGGGYMAITWPLPGSYNIAFGESTLLFGAVFLGTALALAKGWDLLPISVYAFFAGVYALVVGFRIISLGITKTPLISGLGFIGAGLGGITAGPLLTLVKKNQAIRVIAALFLLGVALFWAYTFYNALWGHLESFASWAPLTMAK
jgi:putative membrane protein